MPPLLTQVARLSDGLPLVACQTPAPGMPVTSLDQKEAKELLQKITSGYVMLCYIMFKYICVLLDCDAWIIYIYIYIYIFSLFLTVLFFSLFLK
jgi:hypothetical protein